MAVLNRVVKPTTRKGKRILLAREPQIIEGPKKTLFLKGRRTTEVLRNVLLDLNQLKRPDSQILNKKNDITIFENPTPVELFCKKLECSLFVLVSNSKKRPNNLTIGRTFNDSLLDMVEFGIESFKGLKDFPGEKIAEGMKPCLVFSGPAWEQSEEMQTARSIFVDLFHREKVNSVRLQGLEHILTFIATPDGKILLRSYKVLLKKSDCRIPRIELEEMGPQLNLYIRRSKLASADLMKQACKKPKEIKIHKKKNISRDAFGTTHGRIHVGTQNINKIQTRKMKGLRNRPQKRKASTSTDADESKKPKV